MKIAIIILASALTANAFAQATPPQTRPTTTAPTGTTPALINTATSTTAVQELPMIVSRSILRTYAINQASELNAGLGAQGIISSGYSYKTWTSQKTTDEIVAIAKTLSISADTIDTTQTVWVYCSVNNADGDELFSGSTSTTPAQVGGKWVLPASAGNIIFNFDQASIKLGQDVSYAAIVKKDDQGNLNWYPIYSTGQKIFFPPQSAGLQNAYVQVGFTDGSAIAYAISNGKRLAQTTLMATFNPTFADVVSLKNPASINVSVKSTSGVGVVPTIEVTNTGTTSYNTSLDIVTTEGKRPIRVWMKSQAGTVWSSQALAASGNSIPIPAGVTYFVPEWSPTDFTESPQPVSNGSSGKG